MLYARHIFRNLPVLVLCITSPNLTDDYSCAFFAQHTALLGFRAVIAALFALEEAKHAARAFTFAVAGGIGVDG